MAAEALASAAGFFCRPDGTFSLASGTAIPYNGEKSTGGGARLRRFHGTVLAFAALEYALWTSSCFWVSDTLTNPYFWFDFLLSLVLLLLLPALRKAVDA